MLSFFFNDKGPLIIDWLQQGATINAEVYCNTLVNLKQAIKNQRRGKFMKGMVLFAGQR